MSGCVVCQRDHKMAKKKRRSKLGPRKERGESITCYVLPEIKRDLKKLINIVADDIDLERLLDIGVMTAYAVQYLLCVSHVEASRILQLGKAYEEAHDPDCEENPKKSDGPTSRDKASKPIVGRKRSLPRNINGKPMHRADSHDEAKVFEVGDGPCVNV